MDVKLVLQDVRTVYAVCSERGACEVETLLETLSNEGRGKNVDGVMALLAMYAETPQHRFSTQVRRTVESVDGGWEFRRNAIRLLCFDGPDGSMIISHGYIKKSGGIPRKQIGKLKQNIKKYRREGIAIWKG